MTRLILTIYSAALRLYPAAFRAKYSDQLVAAAHLDLEQSQNLPRTIRDLASDLLTSIPREHLRAATPASPGYLAAFALFFSALLLTVAVGYQQVLRRAADLEPKRVVAQMAVRAAQGGDPAALLDGPDQEIANRQWLESSQVFAAVYNAAGKPVAANATLRGELPQPPRGVFRYARQHGLYKVSWQPGPKIRVALSVQPLSDGSFAIAGQSLIPTETRGERFNAFLHWLWLAMLAAMLAIFVLASPRPRKQAVKPPIP